MRVVRVTEHECHVQGCVGFACTCCPVCVCCVCVCVSHVCASLSYLLKMYADRGVTHNRGTNPVTIKYMYKCWPTKSEHLLNMLRVSVYGVWLGKERGFSLCVCVANNNIH